VPHTPAAQQRRFRFDFVGAFSFASYLILFVVVAMAIGVYAYEKVLESQSETRSAELAKAEDEIVQSTAEGLVRLDNRLSASTELLSHHVAFSRFLTTLGEVLPVTVRFSSLRIAQADSAKITFEGSGVAKNFNALAALSGTFASDSRIKEAVFSGITVSKDYSVNFSVKAEIDQKVVAYIPSTPVVQPQPAPVNATTTTSL